MKILSKLFIVLKLVVGIYAGHFSGSREYPVLKSVISLSQLALIIYMVPSAYKLIKNRNQPRYEIADLCLPFLAFVNLDALYNAIDSQTLSKSGIPVCGILLTNSIYPKLWYLAHCFYNKFMIE